MLESRRVELGSGIRKTRLERGSGFGPFTYSDVIAKVAVSAITKATGAARFPLSPPIPGRRGARKISREPVRGLPVAGGECDKAEQLARFERDIPRAG